MNSQEQKKYSVEDLENLNVTGIGGLRELVVKNKIFKGISQLKKKEIIDNIVNSNWWKDNNIVDKDEKDEDQPNTLKEFLTKKQKLRNEIKEIERRIKEKEKEEVEEVKEVEEVEEVKEVEEVEEVKEVKDK